MHDAVRCSHAKRKSGIRRSTTKIRSANTYPPRAKQLRLAETEKYAHVTFFFNGGVEEPNANEDRTLIASPSVATYDLQPQMSAPEVRDAAIEAINSGKYDPHNTELANPDMVGHTGVFDAAVKAEAVDGCVGDIYDAITKRTVLSL